MHTNKPRCFGTPPHNSSRSRNKSSNSYGIRSRVNGTHGLTVDNHHHTTAAEAATKVATAMTSEAVKIAPKNVLLTTTAAMVHHHTTAAEAATKIATAMTSEAAKTEPMD